MSKDKDKLLSIAQQKVVKMPEETKSAGAVGNNEAKRFIFANNIKVGNTRVYNLFLYENYRDWKKNKNMDRRLKFFKDFGKVFDRQLDTTKGSYYLLDPEAFNLSDDIFWRGRGYLQRERKPYGKKKKKKRS